MRQALKQTPEAERVFLPGGKVPDVGEMFTNPDLGKTLRLIAEQGRDVFYRGEIAQSIVSTSTALGGTMQADDLADFSAEWVEPISINYRGWKVYELPPNGQGMAALEMLNIMSTLPADKGGPLAPHGTAQSHRGDEAGLLRSVPLQRRSAIRESAGARIAVRRLRPAARGADRSGEGELHGGQRQSSQERHHLSCRDRSRRKYCLAHTKSV